VNKRTRELAKQAGFSSWTLNPSVETQSDTPELLERFAELIVRECLTVINQSNGVGDDDVIRISRDVKQHFGVES
jgi:hypothetical protein